jgi:hypothetical protein
MTTGHTVMCIVARQASIRTVRVLLTRNERRPPTDMKDMVISANTPKPHTATCLAVRNHAQRPFVAKRRPRSVFIAAGNTIRGRHNHVRQANEEDEDEQASEVEADPTQHCHDAAPAEAL